MFVTTVSAAMLLSVVIVSIQSASSSEPAAPMPSSSSPAGARAIADLGKRLFFDPALSGSGRMSCATCHSPQHAYGPPNSLAVQLGGVALDRQGARAVPSLRYVLNRTPVWNKPYVASRAERLLEGEEPPRGGFGWDGRFDSLLEQASFPLQAANEMANAGPEAVVAVVKRARYAGEFRRAFGTGILDDVARAYTAIRLALARFELDDPSFYPYSSRFDAYLDGKGRLTAQELRGKALFEDPARGNCATCHPDRKGADGSHPLFTDYQFEALGVPRNAQIRANAAPEYFDEGVCGPLRTGEQQFCGLFKTPTLRNVATRGTFFHNGRFHTLKDALRFYVRRDTDPQLWYPVEKFDDLPAPLRRNVDVIDRPFTLSAGAAPVWTDAEIDAVIAFLGTLTDRDAQPAETLRAPTSAPAG